VNRRPLAFVFIQGGRLHIRSAFGSARVVKVRHQIRRTYTTNSLHLRHKRDIHSPCKFFDKYGFYTIRKYDMFNKAEQLKRVIRCRADVKKYDAMLAEMEARP
jgi:hypothetical protein